MPRIWRKSGGSWQPIKTVYRKTGGSWQSVKRIWRKTGGQWYLIFQQSLTPSIETQVEITLATANSTTQTKKITGTLYHWNNGTGYTYQFAKGSGDTMPASYTNITGASGTSTNPASGSSNTLDTYTLTQADMIQNATNWFIYVSKSTNSTYGTEQTSASFPVTFEMPRNVTTLAVGTVTRNSVDLSWTGTTGSGSYVVYYGTTTSPTTVFTTTTANSVTVTGLSQDTQYYFRILPWTGNSGNGYYGNYSNEVGAKTPIAPGNLTAVETYNFTGGNLQLFYTTGTNTSSVRYYFKSLSLPGYQIGPFTQTATSSYPYKFEHNLMSYLTLRTWTENPAYNNASTYKYNDVVWYAGNQYTGKDVPFSAVAPPNSNYWNLNSTTANVWVSGTSYSSGSVVWYNNYVWTSNINSNTQTPSTTNYIAWTQGQYYPNTYSSSTTYYSGMTVQYNGSSYTASLKWSGIFPDTGTTYWNKTITVTYNAGDYIFRSADNTYYFAKSTFDGKLTSNTTYWQPTSLGWYASLTPYNGTVDGNLYDNSGSYITLIRADGQTTEPLNANTSNAAPTYTGITTTGATANFTPSGANRVLLYLRTGTSGGTTVTGYNPLTVTTSPYNPNTASLTGLSNNSDYNAYLSARYMYNSTYNVYHDGNTTSSSTFKTLAPAPSAFNFTLSQAGSVTTPGTPTITRVSSTSNTLLFDIASSKPADTFRYGINQSGAAITNGTPAQYVDTLNQWDSAGNFGSGIYDTITTILSSATTSSAATISTTAYGNTRSANANVSTTSGASSWAINFSWSGAATSSVTYYSNGVGFTSSSTAATVTVYTNSMPVKIADITGTSDPTITINNITAYSNTNQGGSSTAGTAGATTSLVIGRPTATSASATQNYTYYDPNPQAFTINNVTSTNGTAGSTPTINTLTFNESTSRVDYTYSATGAVKYRTVAYGTAFNPDTFSVSSPSKGPFYTTSTSDYWYYDEAGSVTVGAAAANSLASASVSWGASTNANSYKVAYTLGGTAYTSSALTSTSFSINTYSAGTQQTFVLTGVTAYANADGTGTSKAGTMPTTTTATPTENYSGYGTNSINVTVFVTPAPTAPNSFLFSRNLNGTTSTTRRNWFWNVSTGIGSYSYVIYTLEWHNYNFSTAPPTTRTPDALLTFGSSGTSAPITNANTYNYSGTTTPTYRTMARGSSYGGTNGTTITTGSTFSWARAICRVTATNGTTYASSYTAFA